ncbi:DUF2062 domain-containing protein [Sulfurimonas sp. SAG-AH-194-C20]|nr:DUF2062 domain-containing protein [Sulfurimonas sp. SAG-AH-194-C20]MDF1878452.1 DUF2062 domain-containing protein [Sulfurimonas sp. SAG-AH-194-C20]
MLRKALKKTTQSDKLKAFIKKSKIPPEFLQANRKMISRGVFLGIFIAFIPMPMQMALVLAFMPVFRFNVPIALAMCWLSNPFTMPPMYYMEYLTGSFFIGSEISDVAMSIEWFKENLDDIFIPLYLGTFFFSVIGSLSAFWAVNHFWKKSVNKDKKKHRHHR